MADLGKVRDGLKELNKKLQELLDKYDKLTYDEIRDRLRDIEKTKHDMLNHFPQVFDVDFFTWYINLAGIDLRVDYALREISSTWTDNDRVKRLIEIAKICKDDLHAAVEKANKDK